NAPTVVLPPSTNAMAMPGRTPWARASPRKLIPRRTTQVPTSDVHSAVRATTGAAAWTLSLWRNGSTHHDHGSVTNRTADVYRVSDLLLAGEGIGDEGGVVEEHRLIGVGAGTLLAQRVGVEGDDLDAEAVAEGGGVVGRLESF